MKSSIRGFSLLEMIAVLAIAAILAGGLVPGLVKGIKHSFGTSEEKSLKVLSESLKLYVITNKRIPSSSVKDWGDKLAQLTSEAPDRIVKNQRGYSRALLLDPGFLNSKSSKFNGFTQDKGLNLIPNSPRVMFVSNLSRNVPSKKINAKQFNAIWDQSENSLYIENNEIKVERVNFAAMFHRVLLTNQSDSAVAFALEDGTEGVVTAKSGSIDGVEERYVISDSRLKLYGAPFPSGPLQTSTLVNRSTSFRYVFDGTNWGWITP